MCCIHKKEIQKVKIGREEPPCLPPAIVNLRMLFVCCILIAFQWPGTYCRKTCHCCSSNACCTRSNSPSVFTICKSYSLLPEIQLNKVCSLLDGLWTEYNDGTWPSCCSGRPLMRRRYISTLLEPMRKYWPSLSCGSPRSCHHKKGPFWGHELAWEKHGTCAYPVVHDEYEFFLTTLNVYFKYNVTEVLFEAGYVPSNSEKYPLGGIISAIQNAFHTTPELVCSGDALEELRICFYKNFEVGCLSDALTEILQ
ncbi:hypothetical protein R3W88_034201 [Solanum pinnatisectum]|uniref:Uncharacterized protein n=1 Tax=Solanum pinnatisectum TaxID=50273 RepID=A0AAV9JYU2_9SOLN|nr:hypothetical protein R3W88_034201 [Solanum pinnatisectum]